VQYLACASIAQTVRRLNIDFFEKLHDVVSGHFSNKNIRTPHEYCVLLKHFAVLAAMQHKNLLFHHQPHRKNHGRLSLSVHQACRC
jgi:hypothetical protein